MQQYFIKRRNDTRTCTYPVKVVVAKSIDIIKESYPGWKIYTYKDSGNPVAVNDDHNGDFRVKREVLPNITYNKYCTFV